MTRLLAIPALISMVAAISVATPGAAHADIRTQIAQAQHRLAQLQDESEIAAERFNNGRIQLSAAERDAAIAQDRASKARAKLATMQHRFGALAAQAYINGGSPQLDLVAQAQDPAGFLDRAGYVDSLSREQGSLLGLLRAATQEAQTAQTAADQAVAKQKAIVAGLAQDREQVDKAAAEAQSVLKDLEAKQRELIRQAQIRAARAAAAHRAAVAAQARREAAAAAAAAAELARQRAAAAAAAQQFNNAPAQPAPTPPVSNNPPPSGGGAAVAVQWAYRELGKPYVWGAAGPDAFDCSGLTMYVWGKAGVSLGHYTGAQWNEGTHVSRGSLQPGDLIFFGSPIHHVGIYVGGGQMIEAPHTGANVRVASINRPDYAGAVRVG